MRTLVARHLAATLVGCAAFVASAAPVPGAVEKPTMFASGMDLTLDGRAALYEIPVPRAVYEGVVRADLGDVRVFNAAREIVPHAFRSSVTVTTQEPAPVELVLYPIRTNAPEGIAGVDLRVEQSGDSTVIALRTADGAQDTAAKLVGYVADARALEQAVRAVNIALPVDAADVVARLTIAGSDDLRVWTTLVSDAPIMRLTAGANQLEQRRIAYAPQRFQYLRISWPGREQALELASLRAEPSLARQDAPREWTEVRAVPVPKVEGRYELDLVGRYPVDRLHFLLPQPNTIAAVTIYSRTRLTEAWGFVAGGTVYRLSDESGELQSDDIVVGAYGDRYWRFEVDARGGGLGAGDLGLRAGWVPHRLVFVARGAPPFLLAYGSREASAFAFPISTLVPGYTEATPSGRVSIGVAHAEEPYSLAGENATRERTDWKRRVLWASLVLGVALLGWMALRLARQMNEPVRTKNRG